MKKSIVYSVILVILSVSVTTLGLELGLRVFGDRFRRMAYHTQLGWVPRPGRFGKNKTWISVVDASGIRRNGSSISTTGRPILAVGDSFTFGDEVADDETWAAYLETMLQKRVLNAGVGAYGIDQAVLRAELLWDEYHPDLVLLSFISDDINRIEFSYYPYGRGWKPYFELENGVPRLRNVPVPQGPGPGRQQTVHRVLEYSVLADIVLRRVAGRWWGKPRVERVHGEGDAVGVALLARLQGLTEKRGGRFVAIALATSGRIGSNDRLASFVSRAREKGIHVFDLSVETLQLQPDQLRKRFRPGGHYTPEMNRWIADRIAAYLDGIGLAQLPR